MTPWTVNRIFLFNYDYRNITDLNFAHYSLVYVCGLYCKAAIMQRQSLFSQEICHTTPHENLVVWHWNFLAQFILLFTIKLSLVLVHYFETGNAQQVNGGSKESNNRRMRGKNSPFNNYKCTQTKHRNAKCRYYRPSTTINCRWPTVKQN